MIALVAVLVVLLDTNQGRQPDSRPQAQADPYIGLDLDRPEPSYLLLQYVSEHGGDDHTQRVAIDWLNIKARSRKPLTPSRSDWLLSMLESGGHPDWAIGKKLWIFNSAFNCLHMDKDQERYTRLLHALAKDDADKTMRLYALQHLGSQRDAGILRGQLAEQVHGTLEELAFEQDSEVAGTALVNLVAWNGPEAEPSQELIDLALELASDTQRSHDIRVTALHSVEEHSLELSRKLAPDSTQPTHVRKAAIGWMGKHGGEADIATLQQLAKENFRIAQAAKPALEAIQDRKSGKTNRTLIEL